MPGLELGHLVGDIVILVFGLSLAVPKEGVCIFVDGLVSRCHVLPGGKLDFGDGAVRQEVHSPHRLDFAGPAHAHVVSLLAYFLGSPFYPIKDGWVGHALGFAVAGQILSHPLLDGLQPAGFVHLALASLRVCQLLCFVFQAAGSGARVSGNLGEG